jgi:hypothetical protein
MTIVRTAYRYKRPPRKRQAAALEVPAVVKAADPAKASKHAARVKTATVADLEAEAAAPASSVKYETVSYFEAADPAKASRHVKSATVADFATVPFPPVSPEIPKIAAHTERKSAIATIRRRKHMMLAHLLEDLTPEEVQRRGDAADALFRTIVRRATGKDRL